MRHKMSYFLCVIGMVLIIEAIPYIAFPRWIKLFARYIENVPEKTLQIIGFLAALTGLGFIYLGRHYGM
jgi:uncharacterized protein YjeT (DUF2065 family)